MKFPNRSKGRPVPGSLFSRIVHYSFEVGILIKGFDGLMEFLGGLLLSFFTPQQINLAVALLTQHELSKDPNDWIATHLLAFTSHWSVDSKNFAVLYLVIHGLLKVLVVWALLRSKLWAFPLAMGLFGLFDVYQVYRYTLSHSMILAALILLDAAVIGLTWSEYRRLRKSGA